MSLRISATSIPAAPACRLPRRAGRRERLDTGAVVEAERALTRLISHYRPTLTLIRLLNQSQGAATGEARVATPGFLFDMNSFWQACVSRFLRRNLPASSGRIEDQRRLPELLRYGAGANPRAGSSSTSGSWWWRVPGMPRRAPLPCTGRAWRGRLGKGSTAARGLIGEVAALAPRLRRSERA